jgi:hypothetical protein
MLAGELTVVAYADLGGLGAKQGPPARLAWTLPSLLPLVLPWLALLVLLALPSNRNARAWLIWVPLGALALLSTGLQTAFGAEDNEGLACLIQVLGSVTFGLAAIWLLGSSLARRRQAVGLVLTALGFAAVGLLALRVSQAWEDLGPAMDSDPEVFWNVLFAAGLSGLVYAGALSATGWRCRKRFGAVRVSLWLLLWLWPTWVVALAVQMGLNRIAFGEQLPWMVLLVAPFFLTLVSFALILPFLILSFASSFHRERLKHLLRVPTVAPSVPPTTPAPVAELQSPR